MGLQPLGARRLGRWQGGNAISAELDAGAPEWQLADRPAPRRAVAQRLR